MTCKPWTCAELDETLAATVTNSTIQVNKDGCDDDYLFESIEAFANSATTGSLKCPEVLAQEQDDLAEAAAIEADELAEELDDLAEAAAIEADELAEELDDLDEVDTVQEDVDDLNELDDGLDDLEYDLDEDDTVQVDIDDLDDLADDLGLDLDLDQDDTVQVDIDDLDDLEDGLGLDLDDLEYDLDEGQLDDLDGLDEDDVNVDDIDDDELDDVDDDDDDVYKCSLDFASDVGYRLAEGSHPKECGVADDDGYLQPDTTLCTLANGLVGGCSCSFDGKYYCIPSQWDDTPDEFAWFWAECENDQITREAYDWYIDQQERYPQAIKYDEVTADCDEEFKDADKVKSLNYDEYSRAVKALNVTNDSGSDDDSAFFLGVGLYVLLN